MTGISLIVPGKPRGKGRPKFARRGQAVVTYTDEQTVSMEETIRAIWRETGAQRLPDGEALELTVRVTHERPQNHFRKNGQLSKKGHESPIPTRKPDGDNVFKLVADALNGLAYKDDSQIAYWDLKAQWGIRAHMLIQLQPIPARRW